VDATVLEIDPNSGEARQSGVTVSVSPATATVRTGGAQTFTATVTGAASTVTWSVNNVAGGNSTVGTIDASGRYLAPLAVPSPSTVTVRATSTVSSSSSGTASVTVIPLPTIAAVSPSPVPVGSFTLTVTGAGFTAGSVVSFDGAALATTVVSSTTLTATGNAAAARSSVPVVVTTTDGEVSNTFLVDVVAAPAVTVAISPASASVRINRTQQFTATVQNTSNKTVTWKVNGIAGGNSTVGTISSSGLYRAPSSVPNPSVVTVSATSAADPTKSASAAVTVRRK
jgi:hypothetical protein